MNGKTHAAAIPPVSQVQQSNAPTRPHTMPEHTSQHVLRDPRASSPTEIRNLQRTIGNHAVQRLLARTARPAVIQPKQDISLQASTGTPVEQGAEPALPKENTTGLPDRLKEGVEKLSGLSLDDVHVHSNSSQPAQIQALAYAQGTEISVGPGQEQHLAHEAWHVVQQKQGRVKPTMHVQGAAINDDLGLENEANVMGARASQQRESGIQREEIGAQCPSSLIPSPPPLRDGPIQRLEITTSDGAKLDTKNRQDFAHAVTVYMTSKNEKMLFEIYGAIKTQKSFQDHEAIAASVVKQALVQLEEPSKLMNPLGNLPKDQWWKLFIDRKKQPIGEENGALLFDQQSSPGFYHGMMTLFEHVLAPIIPGKLEPITSKEYDAYHGVIRENVLNKGAKIKGWQKGNVSFPMTEKGASPSLEAIQELFDEGRLGLGESIEQLRSGQYPKEISGADKAILDMAVELMGERTPEDFPSAFDFMDNGFFISSYSTKKTAPGRADAIFKEYDQEQAEARKMEEKDERLPAIVRAIRALHVGHFFEDANGRLNILVLLNKFLLEEGFSPVILEDPAVFGGSMSIRQLVTEVHKGMQNFHQASGKTQEK